MTEVFVSMIAVALLVLLHCSLNAKGLNRIKTVVLPFFSLAYSVVTLFVVANYYDQIMLPLPFAQAIVSSLLRIDVSAMDVLFLNLEVGLVFVFLRIIPLKIISMAFRRKPCCEKAFCVFYAYDDAFQEWLLKNKWGNLRLLVKGLMYSGIVVTGVVLGCIWHRGLDSAFHIYVMPVYALLMITESFIFLNSSTETEYSQNVSGEDSYSNKIRNLYMIRGIYEKIFAHELLTSDTRCDYSSAISVTDLLEKLDASESGTDHKIAEFFRLNGDPNHYDADYISATLRLLDGKNVVFFDPFYRDLGKYLILPILHTLLSNQKCLIITGRESVKSDIADWIKSILLDYGKIESLWRVRELDHKDPECEVGIMGLSGFYDPDIIRANHVFLKRVGFVLVVEPSLIVNTGQIGLGILADSMIRDNEVPVYCFLDRIVDGLIDSLSHVFQIDITEVEAPPLSRNIRTAMTWDADGDYLGEKLFEKQTKYLGNGVELAAVAIKNQIPEVEWYSDSKVPIRDIKWLTGQYYSVICKYMNLPLQQESLYDRLKFISRIWSTEKEDYKFILAEDEYSNMYNTMRVFLSRGNKQTFINVLSENYLLRDYMRCNSQMFLSNPDTVPSIVPDYAKTVRNTLIKILYLMSIREVYESEILREFKLVGVDNDDANSILSSLMNRYFGVSKEILRIHPENRDQVDASPVEENLYSISEENFNRYFGKNLNNAYFICEDEDERSFIDSRLFGHVTQVVLPGQFVVYDGKYYIVHKISADSGVILRRASNLYDGRKYYRQIRRYKLEYYSDEDLLSSKTVMDIQLDMINARFSVNTLGYMVLNKNNDLRTARVVNIENDPNSKDYFREYHNKTILRVKLPDADRNCLFTISMLLSETFRSVFPDAWEYIAVTTNHSDVVDGMLSKLIYGIDGNVEDGYIYIFEDSELDLGLLEAVEKNLIKLLEIITDYLAWHFEKMREPASADAEPVTPEFPKMDYTRRSKLRDLFKRVRSLFGVSKEEFSLNTGLKREEQKDSGNTRINSVDNEEMPIEDKVNTDAEEGRSFTIVGSDTDDSFDAGGEGENTSDDGSHIHDDVDVVETISSSPGVEKEKKKHADPSGYDIEETEDPEIVAIDGTDIFDESGSDEDNEYLEECFVERGIVSGEKSRYQKDCFLKFGFNEIDNRLMVQDVLKYLTVRGFSQNAFRKARKRSIMDESLLDLNAVNHCDFCGRPISGVSYESLNDGRIRCNDCSKTAINSVGEFREIFRQCLSLMQSFYDIVFSVGLNVEVTDARTIARGFGSVYKPSTEYAARVLGYAKKERGLYEIYIENGSPRLAAMATMVHELTHIWQYRNWKIKEIMKLYPDPLQRDIVYEGMAVWSEIQYLYLIGEDAYARDQEMITEIREDVYGAGFRMFREKYPLIKASSLIKYSPFSQFPPM